MTARVLSTLRLPDPFTEIVSPLATIEVIGEILPTPELCARVAAAGADVLCPQLADRIDSSVLDAGGSRLRAVNGYAVGYNNIDIPAATARRVAVGNTPGVLTDATADMAMGLLLATARRICEGDRMMRTGGFAGWTPEFMLGMELRESVLGIVGFGRIGQALARRALACGMRVTAAARDTTLIPDDLADRVTTIPLDSLLATADVVSLHCPLNDATRHLINDAALRRMKPSAILINTARGPIVDEAALVTALQERRIAGAGLDVYEREPEMAAGLAQCENAVLAPHLGSATVRTRAAMAELVARNTVAVLGGSLPVHCVNPEVAPSWLGTTAS